MVKKKKLFGIFDKRPLIWFHYVLLVGVLFASYFTGDYLINLNSKSYFIMAIWFYAWISIGDQLIHKILGVD